MDEKFTAGGYLPASFLDWDGHVSAVVFTHGCNFRCPWCHNSDLVTGSDDRLSLAGILDDIERRAKFLDGVVVSGGEPCMWDGLFPFMRALKDFGLEVKLDTNGSFPDVLEKALDARLADHVAMDIKAPLRDDILSRVTGAPVSAEILSRSVSLIRAKAPSYEFRTTYVPFLLTIDDLVEIRRELDDDEHWFVQCFKPVGCIDPAYRGMKAVRAEEVEKALSGIKVRG